jgi:hypothetical protein
MYNKRHSDPRLLKEVGDIVVEVLNSLRFDHRYGFGNYKGYNTSNTR